MNQTTTKQTFQQAPAMDSRQVLVFKTNILLPAMGIFVRPLLDAMEDIIQWTIDYADCDHVLRVVTTGLNAREIEDIILQAGFTCEELTD
ncbi:hypothetical protein ACX0G9_29970 [Flavitalea flava]